MSDKSLFAVLLRQPWWVSFAVAGVVGAACYNLFPARYASVGIVSGLPFAVIGLIAAWRQFQAPSPKRIEATLQTLAGLSARDFGNALEDAYRNDGYAVTRLQGSVADLSISKAGRVALISSKRWKAATHGLEPLRELGAAVDAQDANQGIYVALNPISDAARVFASKNSIRVLQGTELALLVQKKEASARKAA